MCNVSQSKFNVSFSSKTILNRHEKTLLGIAFCCCVKISGRKKFIALLFQIFVREILGR